MQTETIELLEDDLAESILTMAELGLRIHLARREADDDPLRLRSLYEDPEALLGRAPDRARPRRRPHSRRRAAATWRAGARAVGRRPEGLPNAHPDIRPLAW